MVETKYATRSEIQRLADLVREAVDDGATTAEEIHKRIASLPLDALEGIDLLETAVRDVRKIQDRSIGAVYDLIRAINREVAGLAKEMLAGPARGRHARASEKPRKRAKKPSVGAPAEHGATAGT